MSAKTVSLIMFVAALLMGCATSGIQKDATPDLKENGVLLLPVTDRALFTATGVSFLVVDSKGSRNILNVKEWPEEIPPTDGRGKRFFGAFTLPPGEYRFSYWFLNQTKGGAAKEPKEPITFKLNKGEIIYVGNFNAIRPLGTGQFRDRFSEDIKRYQSIYPWINGLSVRQEQTNPSWWPLPDGKEPK